MAARTEKSRQPNPSSPCGKALVAVDAAVDNDFSRIAGLNATSRRSFAAVVML